ncbi:hypothetical protein GDO78_016826 [Eleutherodactylus coqui]|uniref:Uncharacterized protein n=1 Tax=Eleutherodactylus coqui TaxID=57060 RepID=A0A8J6EKT2_ELECQ|nr:hypothetical protein GDO78_016826 [Eleutherodactylus coqui]
MFAYIPHREIIVEHFIHRFQFYLNVTDVKNMENTIKLAPLFASRLVQLWGLLLSPASFLYIFTYILVIYIIIIHFRAAA